MLSVLHEDIILLFLRTLRITALFVCVDQKHTVLAAAPSANVGGEVARRVSGLLELRAAPWSAGSLRLVLPLCQAMQSYNDTAINKAKQQFLLKHLIGGSGSFPSIFPCFTSIFRCGVHGHSSSGEYGKDVFRKGLLVLITWKVGAQTWGFRINLRKGA